MSTGMVPGNPPLAVHDLGGEGHDLVLAHAAGFHGRAWGPVAERLGGAFHCLAYDSRGHGASVVDDDEATAWDWLTLGADAVRVVDGLGLSRPLGLGHSSGASALLLAEALWPGTFAALYCIEPIGSTTDDPPPPDPDHPMALRARRRRAVFASRQEAEAAYGTRPPLSELSPEALRAYVSYGFADQEDGSVRLRCHPDHEARMYEYGLAHDAYRRLGDVTCPVVLARGSRSQAVGPETLRRWAARLPQARVDELAGVGHLAPLEDPSVVAGAVTAAFARILGPLR